MTEPTTFQNLEPTREDAALVIDALRTLMHADEIFGTKLIPASYANFHVKLLHSLSIRDLVRNAFPVRRSMTVEDFVNVDAPEQYKSLQAWRALLEARRASLKEST